jgi:hypothetical protein
MGTLPTQDHQIAGIGDEPRAVLLVETRTGEMP